MELTSEQYLTNQKGSAYLSNPHLHPCQDHIPHNVSVSGEILSFSSTEVFAVSWLLVIRSKCYLEDIS
jgi:hypothetical protein